MIPGDRLGDLDPAGEQQPDADDDAERQQR